MDIHIASIASTILYVNVLRSNFGLYTVAAAAVPTYWWVLGVVGWIICVIACLQGTARAANLSAPTTQRLSVCCVGTQLWTRLGWPAHWSKTDDNVFTNVDREEQSSLNSIEL